MVRDTGAILLDMIPDRPMADNLRQTIRCLEPVEMQKLMVLKGSNDYGERGPATEHLSVGILD